jgi:putative ABC transport system substrate-binding protein
MRRREFISLLVGSAAAVWPLAAHAQQSAMPLVGFVNSGGAQAQVLTEVAYRRGLREGGFIEGKNLRIETRWADGQYDRLPALVDDLIKQNVSVFMAGGPPAAQAAKKATSAIPIVFTSGGDPVQLGLVSSINRPGGNLTGVHIFFAEVESKKLGLLRELIPNVEVIAALVNPTFSTAQNQTKDLRTAASALGLRLQLFNASSERDLDAAFASMKELKVSAVLVGADPFFTVQRNQIISLATRYAIPAIYEQRSFATAGGLMSYGTSLTDAYRQAGLYTARILKGEKPSELPVLLADKFEFVINLNVAKTLGLTVSPNLLSTADDVVD